MYSYNISEMANKKDFEKACRAIEKEVKVTVKESLLEDVDGTLIQIYHTNEGKIKVFNDYEVDAVYVDSEMKINSFEKAS